MDPKYLNFLKLVDNHNDYVYTYFMNHKEDGINHGDGGMMDWVQSISDHDLDQIMNWATEDGLV